MISYKLKIISIALLVTLAVIPFAVSAEVGGSEGGNVGWFQFNANVEGASVYVDGEFAGYTPYTMKVYSTGTPYKSAYAKKAGYYESNSQSLTMPSAGQTNTYYFTLQERPTQTPPGSFYVTSSPSGGRVSVDGTYYGRTPQTISGLAPGKYTVSVDRDAFEHWSSTYTIKSDQTTRVTAVLSPVPDYGSISVRSSPSGARLYIDGDYKGTTPRTISGIVKGSHTVELEKAGYYEWTGTVHINPGQVTYVSETLSPIPKPTTGTIFVSSTPSNAYIYLDGVYEGVTTYGRRYAINNVAAGSHTILLKLAGYQDSVTSVQVNSGEVSEVNSALTATGTTPTPGGRGTLDVTSSPTGATIYLNNENKGITPLTLRDLPAGSYTVTLKLNGYQDWSTVATVSDGSTSPVTATMLPVSTPTKSGALPIPALAALAAAGIMLAAFRVRKD